jgi:hypothetical protein
MAVYCAWRTLVFLTLLVFAIWVDSRTLLTPNTASTTFRIAACDTVPLRGVLEVLTIIFLVGITQIYKLFRVTGQIFLAILRM